MHVAKMRMLSYMNRVFWKDRIRMRKLRASYWGIYMRYGEGTSATLVRRVDLRRIQLGLSGSCRLGEAEKGTTQAERRAAGESLSTSCALLRWMEQLTCLAIVIKTFIYLYKVVSQKC